MKNLVETLRNESISDNVAYTEFMLQFNKNNNTFYSFFEGYEDRTYYSVRIDNFSKTQSNIDFICGGKDSVLNVRNLIKSNIHYRQVRTGFYVDSDFDSIDIEKDIYVTPTYSIENFYSLKSSVQKVLISEFKLVRETADFNLALEFFDNLIKEFNEQTLYFNSWLACQADYRNENKISTRLNVDGIVKDYFDKFITAQMQFQNNFGVLQSNSSLKGIFPKAVALDDEIIDLKLLAFKQVNPIEKFRGKFFLSFLMNFFSRLQSIAGAASMNFTKKYSCSLRFEMPTLCSALSQYAFTPECLKDYIGKYSASD